MYPKTILYIISILLMVLTGCRKNSQPTTIIRDDYKAYYDSNDVEGCFILFDEKKNRYTIYNEPMTNHPYTPASTFKIFNTMVGLETGVIADENYVIKWDSIVRNPVWDKDYNLKNAFKNSVVWYYKELARRVGGEKMKYWLDTCHYGNADTTGGIDRFWLEGGLRITPKEQIMFLQKLKHDELSFSKHTMDLTREIMIDSDSLGAIVRGKTGWGMQDGKDIGWFVGYAENSTGTYYFSNCISFSDKSMSDEQAIKFDQCRKAIVYTILKGMKIIKD